MVQIYCPKCSVGYEIADSLVKDKTRRLKCSYCGEVFEVGPIVIDNEKDDAITENETANLSEQGIHITDNMGDKIVADTVSENQDKENIVAESVEKTLENDNSDVSENETSVDNDDGEEKASDEKLLEDEAFSFEEIFERLSEQTSDLIKKEKALPIWEKIWFQIKNILGFHFKIKWLYVYIGIALFAFSSLYSHRYDVVRKVPFMNGFYKAFGVKAKIPGEGLEFQNINWDLIKDENELKLQIKGFIYNGTENDIVIPSIHVEILDSQAALLQTQKQKTENYVLAADTKTALDIEIVNPAPISKYIHITFIDDDQ